MKLMEIREFKGKIVLQSGLHIGAGDTEMKIGGTDNPVVKHPHTQEPYIPGSSIKGKVRSLLEMRSGLMVMTKGSPIQAGHLKNLSGKEKTEAERILKLFGSGGADAGEIARLGPTRVSFADCPVNGSWREKVKENRLGYFEVKSENSINRIQGTAENPRFSERVTAGTEFDFSVSLKQLGEEEDLLSLLLEGLKLLEKDALGGSGSRGYGRLRFTFEDEAIQTKFDALDPFHKGG